MVSAEAIQIKKRALPALERRCLTSACGPPALLLVLVASMTSIRALALGLGLALLSLATPVFAQRTHEVVSGQTLSAIAKKHRVSISNLAAANGLRRNSLLRVGQVLDVPEQGVVYVYRGQSLTSIAKSHGTTIKQLAKLNGLTPNSSIREGQRLRLPGHKASIATAHQRKYRRNVAVLYRPAHDESARVRLLDQKGRVRKAARDQLSRFLRDRQTNKQRRPHPRLVRVLARVSNHFRGRRIVVISGYRSSTRNNTKDTSRHAHAAAVDIRVEGVPNEELRDYCRGFSNLGVGYYPRSTFVHIDVRDKDAYWVDWSRPGEPPSYMPPGETPPAELGTSESSEQEPRLSAKGAQEPG